MIEFSKEDFKRMTYDMSQVGDGESVLAKYPDIAIYKSFTKMLPNLDKDKVIKYIGYVYDKGSPYRVQYKDLNTRKIKVMSNLGYTFVNKRFPDEIEEVILCNNDKVNAMIIDYCKLHANVEYSHLVVMETLYTNKMKEVIAGYFTGKTSEIESIKESFVKAQDDFLMSDKSKDLVKELYRGIERERVELTPEDIAEKVKTKGVAGAVKDLNEMDKEDGIYEEEDEFKF